MLADAIQAGRRLLIVADYDCDGATACAVGLRALSAMGADVDFLVPNRFETGYGLSPAVVDLAVTHRNGKPDIIITVDNGIASVDGVGRQCRRHRRGHHRPPPAGRHAARRAGHREPTSPAAAFRRRTWPAWV